jgi:hypothetical protein
MRLDTMKSKYPEMYREIFVTQFNGNSGNRKEVWNTIHMNGQC